jgi:hypothetical protein
VKKSRRFTGQERKPKAKTVPKIQTLFFPVHHSCFSAKDYSNNQFMVNSGISLRQVDNDLKVVWGESTDPRVQGMLERIKKVRSADPPRDSNKVSCPFSSTECFECN